MAEKTLDEPILEDGYPVYPGFCYVVDGKVVQSTIEGTVARLKISTGGSEIRRCDLVGRGLM